MLDMNKYFSREQDFSRDFNDFDHIEDILEYWETQTLKILDFTKSDNGVWEDSWLDYHPPIKDIMDDMCKPDPLFFNPGCNHMTQTIHE